MIGFELLEASSDGDQWTFRLHVPPDSAYFVGHFPGEPVLSAVAQLAMASQLLKIGLGPNVSLNSIRTLRFRTPVYPGQTLVGRLTRTQRPGEVRFHLDQAETNEVVADGFLNLDGLP